MKLWMSTFADVEKDFSLWANRDKCRSRIKSTWLNLIGVLILVGAVSYYFIFWQKSWSTPLITVWTVLVVAYIADMLFWIGFWSRCNTAAETIPDGVKSGMEKTLKRTNFIFILAVLYAVCAVAAYVILGAASLVLAALVIIGPLYIVSELVRIVLRANMYAMLKS